MESVITQLITYGLVFSILWIVFCVVRLLIDMVRFFWLGLTLPQGELWTRVYTDPISQWPTQAAFWLTVVCWYFYR
jgi:hypothetical protein